MVAAHWSQSADIFTDHGVVGFGEDETNTLRAERVSVWIVGCGAGRVVLVPKPKHAEELSDTKHGAACLELVVDF